MDLLQAARARHMHDLGFGASNMGSFFPTLPPTFGGSTGTYDPTFGLGVPPPLLGTPPPAPRTNPSTGVIVASVAQSVAQSLAAIFNRNQQTGAQGQLPPGFSYDQYGRIVDARTGQVVVTANNNSGGGSGSGIFTVPGGVSIFGTVVSWPMLAVGAGAIYLLQREPLTRKR